MHVLTYLQHLQHNTYLNALRINLSNLNAMYKMITTQIVFWVSGCKNSDTIKETTSEKLISSMLDVIKDRRVFRVLLTSLVVTLANMAVRGAMSYPYVATYIESRRVESRDEDRMIYCIDRLESIWAYNV